jgi:LSD1 subclass zinc finger protein
VCSLPFAYCRRARKLIRCTRGPTVPLHHMRVLGGLVRWCRSNSDIRARVASLSPVGVMHRLPLIVGRGGGTVRCSSCRTMLLPSEKPSGPLFGLIMLSHCLGEFCIRFWDSFVLFFFYLCFVRRITFACLVVCRRQVRHGMQRRGPWQE